MNNTLDNIKLQLKSIDIQFETLFFQIKQNSFQNTGYQLYDLSIQMLNKQHK